MKSMNRSAPLAVVIGAAILVGGGEASAAKITRTRVTDQRELAVHFADPAHRNQTRKYTLTTVVSAQYGCASDGEVLSEPTNLTVIRRRLDRTWEHLPLDALGSPPGGYVTLDFQEPRLHCPSGYQTKPVDILFSEIQLAADGEPPAFGYNTRRTFRVIRGERVRATPGVPRR